MSSRSPLLAGVLIGAILVCSCGDDAPAPTPTPVVTPAPTPPPAPPPPAPAEPAALASVALNPSTVISQGNPEGTVTLTAAAPTGGAVVTLSSGNTDVARVPASVTVAAGSTSNTFRVDTSTVPSSAVVTIIATYAGVTRTAPLTVQPPPLEARFTAQGAQRGADACDIINATGAVDCHLNASTSGGFVARYLWTLKVGNTELAFTLPDEQATFTPTTTCGLMANGTAADGKVPMEVSLQLEDRGGNRSGITRRTIDVYHNQRCGFQ